MTDRDIHRYLESRRTAVEEALDRALPPEDASPPLIHRAMRYAVFAGGKRLRPILVLAGCEAVDGDPSVTLAAACAVECIHTYSLIHDDLPALDNDDLRRGRPTVHKAFDEATAILAGDALLTAAFEMALGPEPPPAAQEVAMEPSRDVTARDTEGFAPLRRLRALRVLAGAIGTSGMIGGQVDDLLATNRSPDESLVRSIHERKTGALLRACPLIGGILAGARASDLSRLEEYGSSLGLAFQIVDDILDIEETAQSLGKATGKDAAARKATYPAAVGVERSRAIAGDLAARARRVAEAMGPNAAPLVALADFVVRRRQ